MKYLFITLACITSSLGIQAQIPNSSFETTSFEITGTDIDQWGVQGAQEQLKLGSGNFAVKVSNTDKAAMLLSDVNSIDPNNMAYFRMLGRPDSLKVWLQFDLQGTDTLFVVTRNEELNAPFGSAVRKFTGSRSTWSPITAKISYLSPGFADSAMIAVYIKSANPTANNSWFAIDAMKFVNLSGNEVSNIHNKNFSDWQGDSIAYPMSWTTTALVRRKLNDLDDQDNARISSTAAAGVNALALETNASNGNSVGYAHSIIYDSFSPGLSLTNAKPGFLLSQRYTFMKGKYKFTQTGGDSAVIQVVMFEQGQVVSNDRVVFNQSTTSSGYEDFTIPIYYPGFAGTPDACLISMYSSHPDIASPSNGTTLWVDALNFTKDPNSVQKLRTNALKVVPNPIKNNVNLSVEGEVIKRVMVYDLTGKSKLELTMNAETATLDLSKLSTGTYIIHVYTNKSSLTKQVQVSK